jgi:uncharacterized membrane protein
LRVCIAGLVTGLGSSSSLFRSLLLSLQSISFFSLAGVCSGSCEIMARQQGFSETRTVALFSAVVVKI